MNIKTILFCLLALTASHLAFGQDQKSYGKLYRPEANAAQEIQSALEKAAAQSKFVLLQGGGNWCGWCYRFHDFIGKDEELKKLAEENFVWYHLNFSPENNNEALFEKYGFPQRFGFPVLIVLDAQGNRLHTQDSALLESGESYDRAKVLGLLKSWSPKALDPAQYKK